MSQEKWENAKNMLAGLLILFFILSASAGGLLLICCSTKELIISIVSLNISLIQLLKILFSDLIGVLIIIGVMEFLSHIRD